MPLARAQQRLQPVVVDRLAEVHEAPAAPGAHGDVLSSVMSRWRMYRHRPDRVAQGPGAGSMHRWWRAHGRCPGADRPPPGVRRRGRPPDPRPGQARGGRSGARRRARRRRRRAGGRDRPAANRAGAARRPDLGGTDASTATAMSPGRARRHLPRRGRSAERPPLGRPVVAAERLRHRHRRARGMARPDGRRRHRRGGRHRRRANHPDLADGVVARPRLHRRRCQPGRRERPRDRTWRHHRGAPRQPRRASPGSRPERGSSPLRALGGPGTGSLDHDPPGVRLRGRAVAPRIVVASLASDPYSPTVRASAPAIRAAFNTSWAAIPDTLFVVAAGNDGNDNDDPAHPTFPCDATAANLLCVGASDRDDEPARLLELRRSHGRPLRARERHPLDLDRQRHAEDSGTSMATPLVRRAPRSCCSRDGRLTTARLRNAVLESVDPAGAVFLGLAASGGRLNARGGRRVRPRATTTATAWRTHRTACPAALGRPPDGCPDRDADGVPDSADPRPTVAGPAHGCPPRRGDAAAAAARAIADRDGDGRSDSADACPTESATTATGARSAGPPVKVTKRKHHKTRCGCSATRSRRCGFTLERRACNSHGRKCRWRTAGTRTVVTARTAPRRSPRARCARGATARRPALVERRPGEASRTSFRI